MDIIRTLSPFGGPIPGDCSPDNTPSQSEPVKTRTDHVERKQYEEPKDFHVEEVLDMELTFDPVKARYVKFTVLKTQELPEWHNGAGKPAFVFLDEFKVY